MPAMPAGGGKIRRNTARIARVGGPHSAQAVPSSPSTNMQGMACPSTAKAKAAQGCPRQGHGQGCPRLPKARPALAKAAHGKASTKSHQGTTWPWPKALHGHGPEQPPGGRPRSAPVPVARPRARAAAPVVPPPYKRTQAPAPNAPPPYKRTQAPAPNAPTPRRPHGRKPT